MLVSILVLLLVLVLVLVLALVLALLLLLLLSVLPLLLLGSTHAAIGFVIAYTIAIATGRVTSHTMTPSSSTRDVAWKMATSRVATIVATRVDGSKYW
jgi:hypothetical protein